MGNVSEAKNSFLKYVESKKSLMNMNNKNEEIQKSISLYANLISYYEKLYFSNKNKQISCSDKFSKIDEIIEKNRIKNKLYINVNIDKEKEEMNNFNDNIDNNDNEMDIDEEFVNNNDKKKILENLLMSSVMDDKIISGNNNNNDYDDYKKLSYNLMNTITKSYDKNLSSKFLKEQNEKNKIKEREMKPFNDNIQLNSVSHINTKSFEPSYNILSSQIHN